MPVSLVTKEIKRFDLNQRVNNWSAEVIETCSIGNE